MALEFLVNPRAAPRARARCDFTAALGDSTFEGHTEDIGPHGCQLISPRSLPKGTLLQLMLRSAVVAEPLRLAATVAWASPQAPWRLGVAFVEAARPAATRFFDALVAAQPGLAGWRQVPDRISLDAMVWLAPPPKLVVDFTHDEVAVLTAIGTGATVFELKTRLRGQWARAERAFFSLLASRHVTLSRGGAVPFANWATLLRELQAEAAAASLSDGAARPPPAPPRPATASAPPAPPAPPAPRSPVPSPPPPSRAAAPAAWPPAAADYAADGSGGLDLDPEALELDLGPGQSQGARGLRPGLRERSPEAQEAWLQALEELAAGRQVTAAALLRAAMALAPGDPEIAKKFGEVSAGRG